MAIQTDAKRRSRLERFFIRLNRALRGRTDTYLARRPHRSFRRTRRRDYARSFSLPGYVALTRQTFGIILRNRKLFGLFFLLATVASALALGVASQENYAAVADALKQTTPNTVLTTLALFGAAISGGFNPTTSANSGVLASLLAVLAWLILVWLLRHVINGKTVTLREGIYNAGAPLVPTALITIVGIIQLIPLFIVIIGYSAASNAGLLAFGIEAMLFYAVGALLATLSVYWAASTFIALIIITLPGMYPVAALRAAGDLVVGRRLRLILRLAWLIAVVVIVWAVILIPIILLANVITVSWLPLVPVAILCLTTLTLIIASTYIYLLYRFMVDDGAKPA